MTWSGPTVPRHGLRPGDRGMRFAVRWSGGQIRGYLTQREAHRAAAPCDADPYQLRGEVCLVVDVEAPPMTYRKEQ
jgi:hypothetical protein